MFVDLLKFRVSEKLYHRALEFVTAYKPYHDGPPQDLLPWKACLNESHD